jgi:hypothetical protein
MNECTNNILNIEVCTNGGSPCYEIEIACESGEAIAGAKEVRNNAEFMLPDGCYKVTVTGDVFSSPRMQQRWITIRGCAQGIRYGMTFIFERLRYENPVFSKQKRYPEKPQKQCNANTAPNHNQQCHMNTAPMAKPENIVTRCMSNSTRNDIYRKYINPAPSVCSEQPKGRGKRK